MWVFRKEITMVEKKVASYVKKNHLNKAAVARAMNLNRDAFYSIVSGKRKITADEFATFCEVVNRSSEDILSIDD